MTPTILECAFIIDDILSTGRRISNDEIYEELNNIFNIVDILSSDYKKDCTDNYTYISRR